MILLVTLQSFKFLQLSSWCWLEVRRTIFHSKNLKYCVKCGECIESGEGREREQDSTRAIFLQSFYYCRFVKVKLLHRNQWIAHSASKRSIRRFVITEKVPTRAFSWLKVATTAFTFELQTQFHVERPWGQHPFNIVS